MKGRDYYYAASLIRGMWMQIAVRLEKGCFVRASSSPATNVKVAKLCAVL
jgi:hypothetical protein